MNKDKAFDKWQELRAKAYKKGEDLSKADKEFEQWLIKQQVEENKKENPSLYR